MKHSTQRAWIATKTIYSSLKRSTTDTIENGDPCGCRMSASEVALIVADEYFSREEQKPKLHSTPLVAHENGQENQESGDIGPEEKYATASTWSSESNLSESIAEEEALALEVGIGAHEYLEECFYTEVSVLDREKFNSIPELVKSDFTIKGHLGKGSFSDVFEVVAPDGSLKGKLTKKGLKSRLSRSINTTTLSSPSRCNNEHEALFAMKCLRPQIRSDVEKFTIGAEDIVHETAILASLDHPHIIKVHGRAAGHLTNAFVLNDGYFVILDRLQETLSERIESWKQSPIRILQGPRVKEMEVAHSIADAMAYLHSKNMIFRDLKPDNVGFDSTGVVKLFDFGFAVGLPKGGAHYERCGSPRYMAPEVALRTGYGFPADVHSFGMLLWEICALEKPMSTIKSSKELDELVFIGGMRPVIENRWPKAAKELMCSCWSASPSKRPTMLNVKSNLSRALANASGGKKKSKRDFPSKMKSRSVLKLRANSV